VEWRKEREICQPSLSVANLWVIRMVVESIDVKPKVKKDLHEKDRMEVGYSFGLELFKHLPCPILDIVV